MFFPRPVAVGAALASVFYTFLSTTPAHASCLSTDSCLCPGWSSAEQSVLTGKVELSRDAEGAHAFLRIETEAAVSDAGASEPGERIELSDTRVQGEALVSGQRLIAVREKGATASPLAAIGADDYAKCSTAPSFKIKSAAAVKAALSPTCGADLRAQGLPPDDACNDTIGSCAASRGSGSGPASPLLISVSLATIALRLARRRR